MKFSRLRLSGFKSFVDPTELIIETGLTGVVGPNGCGKSNLLEGLRWVMGENRPTTMRGSGMEDVIFGGTGSRPLRNHAEVTLVIDNTDRSAPAPYNEFDTIEVSRRIERDAGSVYRINGRDVRQRDVQLFFADAATGSNSPSLVRQGHISVLINQKPLARRAILEEAAGIGGLHQRRHEAELRLKAAAANLERLDDVITEVEGQLQGLRRQARQASRYRNLSGLIHKAEALAFLMRWQLAEAQDQSAATTLGEATEIVTERTQLAASASKIRVDATNALPPLREAESVQGAALQRLLHERDSLETETRRAREEAQRLRQRIGQSEQDRNREHGLEQDAELALAKLTGEAEELRAASSRTDSELAAANAHARELGEALSQAEAALEDLTSQFANLNARRTSYERDRDESIRQTERAETQLEEMAPHLDGAEGEASGAAGVLAAENAVEAVRAKAAAALAFAERVRHQEGLAMAAEAAARAPFDAAEREVQRLSAESDALAKLLHRVDRDLWPPLIDSLRVEPGYEAALAAAFGDDLDAPLDEAAPQYWRDLGNLDSTPALPDGAVALSRYVEGPAALARRLAFTGVVSPDAGAAAHKQLRPGQRLVSQRGDLWRWDGYRVSAEAESAATVRLEQRNRLEALEQELALAKANNEAARSDYVAAQAETVAARDAAQAGAQELRRCEADLIAAQDDAAKAARAAGEKAAQFATLAAELRNLRAARDSALVARQVADDALAALPDGNDLERRLSEARSAAGAARSTTGEAVAAVEAHRRVAADRNHRLTTIGEDQKLWTSRHQAATEKISELGTRLADMQAELATLESMPDQIEQRSTSLIDAISKAEAARSSAADARAKAENALVEADKAARSTDHALSEAREERAGAAARAEAASTRLAELGTRIRDELDAVPDELAAIAGHKPGTELPPLEQAEDKVDKLKREREQIGGVNLRAEEEASEQEQRLRTLREDRADLDGAIQRLRRGIQSLNREGRERLLASFEKVNSNFEKLFKELFQGGEARLTFTESEDPLEAGLEILARPPGKKLTTLSLLSGGEQALTAIALIFAVFLVNPAPICVLDEVDAPLDDTNVDRFCRLLEEMTRMTDTRYMIITHHALTMSRMERLFGVTMAERGVSQLVSVSLVEAERVIAA